MKSSNTSQAKDGVMNLPISTNSSRSTVSRNKWGKSPATITALFLRPAISLAPGSF